MQDISVCVPVRAVLRSRGETMQDISVCVPVRAVMREGGWGGGFGVPG